ncbi:MAG: hypothetical protein N3G20_06345, partial [Verrucomicrobiae bacterium]|nr:hypothetical protein [Verrucomicrobiae bacterium]
PMKPDAPRTLGPALDVMNSLAVSGDSHARIMANVARLAVMHDESGQPCVLFRNEPWCNGAVWSLNPNPWLGLTGPAKPGENTTNLPLNAGTVHWNEEIKERLYGPNSKGKLDGEYLDSLEGYVTAELNFRREHFKYTTVPLAFDTSSKQPALFKGLAVFEFTKWIADDVHRMGRLTFANGVPYRFTFLCPWLDVLGTEIDWLSGGTYRPAPHSTMVLWRTMAGRKPYLLLMNSNYDRFTPELVEKYFQRCLFYGMWPGFFSHNASENPYWQNPKWYERDRPVFKKYVPVIRSVSEAGWQPITHAHTTNPHIWIERFGPDRKGKVFFTCFNDAEVTQTGWLRFNASALGSPKTPRVTELLSGTEVKPENGGLEIALQPAEAKVFCLEWDAR